MRQRQREERGDGCDQDAHQQRDVPQAEARSTSVGIQCTAGSGVGEGRAVPQRHRRLQPISVQLDARILDVAMLGNERQHSREGGGAHE